MVLYASTGESNPVPSGVASRLQGRYDPDAWEECGSVQEDESPRPNEVFGGVIFCTCTCWIGVVAMPSHVSTTGIKNLLDRSGTFQFDLGIKLL